MFASYQIILDNFEPRKQDYRDVIPWIISDENTEWFVIDHS